MSNTPRKARKIAHLLVIATCAITLTACANGPIVNSKNTTRTAADGGWISVNDVLLPNGRHVYCASNGNGISCDWNNQH
ncbi:hypothetical protein ATY41_02840 [Leifsonia xyli subsp. xyli]|uniref:Lipoprotein n=1 Tax=Leifsonia xyli subsp. xyli TaxID=59736 RepID=A0A1E2SJG8_LEIXY|nr:hypothetical protein [Leifsonia xyli]ODA89995.1 hypothetical protein ATY41_02840 [Leifsonia xyli subsp. xyli]